MRSSRAFFRASKLLIYWEPKALTSSDLSNLVTISSSYCFIFCSTCCNSCEIFVSRLSIFSNSPLLFASSPSNWFLVVSEFWSCLLLKSSSSSISRMWPSGETLRANVDEMLSSSLWMLSCFSSSLASSSAFVLSKLSMKVDISWSFVNRISYFCWSLCMSAEVCVSVVTSLICAFSRSRSSFSSPFLFSAATISVLSLFTLASSSSRCSGMDMQHCFASSSRTARRLPTSLLTSCSCRALMRYWSDCRCPSRDCRRSQICSFSSRRSARSAARRWFSSRSSSYSRCWSGWSSFRRSSFERASWLISWLKATMFSLWLSFSKKIASTSARSVSFDCFIDKYMMWTSSGGVSVRCLSVAKLWSARSPSSARTFATSSL
mmetsp:Transcript_2995/g.9053  ORF Transcript_2995/g.9053 Transcript_2995/m.9053 type:complete len:377 (-) Transcript_2995:306-1436(-)